jgi:predicted nucleic-acid-binding protein
VGSNVTRAVDTNVIIRYLTCDDPVQTPIATEILRSGFLITATVLIESEWVLRSHYRWPRERIHQALVELLDLPTAYAIPDGAQWSLARFAQGADFADMIHIATSRGATSFASFGHQLAALAGPDSPIPIETLA